MNPKTILWVVVAVVATAAIAIGLSTSGAGGIEDVDAAGVKNAIAADAQVIDVRTPGEYQLGHIPGAINVPVDQLEQSASSWDRNKTYVVYCATGARSLTAVQVMKRMGFGSIKHFAAGIQAWDGQMDKGEAVPASNIETNGKPVLIEFFTDS